MKRTSALVSLACLSLGATAAVAAPARMIEPIDAVILAGGAGSGAIFNTIDQSGLAAGYVSGVTPLHPYTAVTTHSLVFAGNEWFSDAGTTSAVVSYLVDRPGINHFVLWNEDASGIGRFNLWFGMTPGDMGLLLLSGVTPTDHPVVDYLSDVWELAPKTGPGWYTVEAWDCPQPLPGSYPACAIGEVAFGSYIPEPGSWALLIAGFGLVGLAARRRHSIVSA